MTQLRRVLRSYDFPPDPTTGDDDDQPAERREPAEVLSLWHLDDGRWELHGDLTLLGAEGRTPRPALARRGADLLDQHEPAAEFRQLRRPRRPADVGEWLYGVPLCIQHRGDVQRRAGIDRADSLAFQFVTFLLADVRFRPKGPNSDCCDTSELNGLRRRLSNSLSRVTKSYESMPSGCCSAFVGRYSL